MIIVMRSNEDRTNHQIALCEERRRSSEKIYVQKVKGHLIPRGGYGKRTYIYSSDVLAWEADEVLFDKMLSAIHLSRDIVARLERGIHDERHHLSGYLQKLSDEYGGGSVDPWATEFICKSKYCEGDGKYMAIKERDDKLCDECRSAEDWSNSAEFHQIMDGVGETWALGD